MATSEMVSKIMRQFECSADDEITTFRDCEKVWRWRRAGEREKERGRERGREREREREGERKREKEYVDDENKNDFLISEYCCSNIKASLMITIGERHFSWLSVHLSAHLVFITYWCQVLNLNLKQHFLHIHIAAGLRPNLCLPIWSAEDDTTACPCLHTFHVEHLHWTLESVRFHGDGGYVAIPTYYPKLIK